MRPLRDIARSVTIWCQSELLPLVERTDGVDRAFALHDGAPDHQFEVDIEIMEVPHAVKARRDQIEMRIPYLALPSAVAPTLPQGGGRAVGLVWEVGNWDKRRTIPSALLRRLVVPGVTLARSSSGPARPNWPRSARSTSARLTLWLSVTSCSSSISWFASTRWLRILPEPLGMMHGSCCMLIATGAGH